MSLQGGYAMKSQRQLIYDVLCMMPKHPTAQDVFLEVRKQQPHIAIGTVYRNLNLLCDDGIIMRIAVNGAPDRYDDNPQFHDHIVCKRCGRVRDVQLETAFDVFSQAAGSRVIGYDLLLYEICEECMGAESSG